MGFFSKIKAALSKTKQAIGYKLNKLFTGGVLNDEFFEELEMILLSSDIGSEATEAILDELKKQVDKQMIRKREDVLSSLKTIMLDILTDVKPFEPEYPLVFMIVGVNGVGKTTAIGKLANLFRSQKKSVIIAAADTFRAAASEQLSVWAERANVKIVRNSEGADPASVVFDAIKSAQAKNMDVLLVDTAGRLHNKVNLMEELKKMSRIITREYPQAHIYNLLAIDATTGQNAINQVELFDEAVDIDGIILNKLDGTAKGGVVLAISKQLGVPVVYAGVGETIDDIQEFDPEAFIDGIL